MIRYANKKTFKKPQLFDLTDQRQIREFLKASQELQLRGQWLKEIYRRTMRFRRFHGAPLASSRRTIP
jgi:hypothetical protein